MSNVTLEEQFKTALEHQHAGRVADAELLYRQILTQVPNHADSLHLLGMVCFQTNRIELARQYIAGSLALNPNFAPAYANMGLVLQARGEIDHAIKCHARAIELSPNESEYHNRLGLALKLAGRLDDAAVELHKAISLNSGNSSAHNNLANVLQAQGRIPDALAAYRRALELSPENVEALNNLGNCLRQSGLHAEAIGLYLKALSIRPDSRETLANLATAWEESGHLAEAIDCYRRLLEANHNAIDVLVRLGNALMDVGKPAEAAIHYTSVTTLDPNLALGHYNLGCALQLVGRPDEAVECFRQAMTLAPAAADVANNLGSALRDAGRVDEAIAAFERAVELKPDYSQAADNVIYSRLFHPRFTPAEQLRLARRWAEGLEKQQPPSPSPGAGNVPHRRSGQKIRIGYVSPDFRDHVVGRNILPVLRRHDRSRFEIYLYSNVQRPDSMTEQFRNLADRFVDISKLNDQQAIGAIIGDQIDILVDLALHLTHNRLAIFAARPAPIQMTWAGYPGSTGLSAIDYRITDPFLDPPGVNAQLHSVERPARLPHSFWCYDPLGIDIPVSPLPAKHNGVITFGCLNSFAKLNAATLSLWADVMTELPGSRLHLLAPLGTARAEVLKALAGRNIEADRVTFQTHLPRREYLGLYHDIDIALDTFPYNGHTTSLDALWMGVPVVTIAGTWPIARAGVSQLSNLGLTELIANSPSAFVVIAVGLAKNPSKLVEIRQNLRSRMEASPLMDSTNFTQALESLFVAASENRQ